MTAAPAPAPAGARRRLLVWLPWVLCALVLAAGLALGSSRRAAPASLDARVRAVASDIRCPSCSDLNAAQSNAETAVAVRALIRTQLQAGRTPAQIEAYLVSRYGSDIVLRPPARGVSALVWVLPAGAALVALVVVYLAVRRWSGRSLVPAEPGPEGPAGEDRRRVEEALGR